jgi:ligand-binding SRPBCC domain-containing protein
MVHTFGCTVDAPLDEVFAWHARPGAIVRLMPPWLPVRVAAETASLRDGRAELALPRGLRWVARHDPAAAYDPPRRFADELASLPLRAALPWRHIHEFAALAPSSTRVTDHITTPLPDGLLRPVMGYRHRQLTGDLAAHQRARQLRSEPLTVAITGSSGLVGSALAALLTSGGHRVIRLVRRAPADDSERRWDPDDPHPGLLRGTGALVHLAGASIAGRLTAGHKRSIRASRITPTRRLAELAAATPGGPAVMVPRRGEELLTEDSPRGDGFLADVVAGWEAASAPAQDAGRSLTTRWPGRSMPPPLTQYGTPTTHRHWPGCCAARCSCPCPAWAHGFCSAPRAPANWPGQTSGSARGGCSVTATGSVTLSWSRPCATCSAMPVRALGTANMTGRKESAAAIFDPLTGVA